MAQIQIKCPNSGLWASVGRSVDAQDWDDLEIGSEVSSCGICGEPHFWSKREARVVDWAWSAEGWSGSR